MLRLAIVVLVGLVATTMAMSVEEKLVATITKDYNKGVNPTGTTPLQFSMSYMCATMDKYTLGLTSRVMEKFTWVDKRLTWNPTDYENMKMIRYPANMIWTPDLKLYNTHKNSEERDEVNVVIYNNGTVMWVPMTTYRTNCLPNGRNTFMCQIKIGSWTYDAKLIKMTMEGEGLDKTNYLDTCPHAITDIKAKVMDRTYPCCPDDKYQSMEIEFMVHDRV